MGFAPLVVTAVKDYRKSGAEIAAKSVVCNLTGFDLNNQAGGGWKPELGMLSIGLGPIVAGLLLHKFVGGSLGVNRALGRANIPLLRI
jgi:hypothetical protein